jgi:hypothetical protein
MTDSPPPVSDSAALDSRPYWIIMGLFYPGILGALIYEIGPQLYSWPWTWGAPRILLFVMLLHYALDYAYTADDQSKSEYSWYKFPFDFVLVWLLYAALRAANANLSDASSVVYVCWLMLATKLCALLWESVAIHRAKRARYLALVSDAIPLLSYGALIIFYARGAVLPGGVVVLLIFLVLLDALLYWVHRPVYELFKRKRSDRARAAEHPAR